VKSDEYGSTKRGMDVSFFTEIHVRSLVAHPDRINNTVNQINPLIPNYLGISIPVFDKNSLMEIANRIIPKNFLRICRPFGPGIRSKKVVSRRTR
jgi:hypothetical protein